MAFEWITYKGKRILLGRTHGIAEEEARLVAIEEIKQEILRHRGQPRSVLFMNCSDGLLSERLTAKWKELSAETQDTTKACAVVGLSFFARSFARLISRGIYFASDEEDAKDWLVRQ